MGEIIMIHTILNRIILIMLFISLISCTTAVMPVTSDVRNKLQHVYRLMSDGKSLDAYKLIGEILEVSEKAGDVLMIAHTHAVFGDLYKLGKTQDSLILPDFKQAALSYQKAAKNYHVAGHYITESMLLWTSGIMHSNAGDKDVACDNFDNALKVFRLDSIDKNSIKSPEMLPERVKAEQKKI